jgi:esterase/lipase superfamily enzyme
MVKHMYRAFLLAFAALVVEASVGQSQAPTAGPAVLQEQCRAAGAIEPLGKLEQRQQQLEREIAKLAEAVGEDAQPSKASDALAAQRKTLRARREALLQLMLQIECARTPEVIATRAPALKKAGEVVEVTTYYATNRNQTSKPEPTKVYGSKFEPSLHYGRTVVSVPAAHTRGFLERPKLWKLEREADPAKHFILKAVTPMSQDGMRQEMLEKFQATGKRALLVFVHGYNMSFAEAALRTAQLAHDLNFPGLPFFYSWPSANQLLGYWQDEETAQLSEGVFTTLLDELSALPDTEIYIVAHSMGNRIVVQGLRARVEAGKDTKRFREVLLAAPDINAELFRRVLAPKIAAMQGTRTTIYASSSDLALKASKAVHGFRRLGETIGGVFTYSGIDTIDASSAKQQTNLSYGHFYLMDNATVLKDVRTLIDERIPAKQRGLNEVGQAPNVFWRFR